MSYLLYIFLNKYFIIFFYNHEISHSIFFYYHLHFFVMIRQIGNQLISHIKTNVFLLERSLFKLTETILKIVAILYGLLERAVSGFQSFDHNTLQPT